MILYSQGYLACNRFGTFLGLAHAAMTAEGDNSVLMQKVAKERLSALHKSGSGATPSAPALSADCKAEALLGLLRVREARLFEKLGKRLAAAQGKEGFFSTWMLQESDLVQAAARAYGDTLVAEK